MIKKRAFSLPKQRDFEAAYRQAYQLAIEELAGLKGIRDQCRKSGSAYAECGQNIFLTYLGKPYSITLPDIDIVAEDSSKEVPLRDKLLILHYFLRADGRPLCGRLITFKELPEGFVYFPNFYKRAVKPLLNRFGKKPELLPEETDMMSARPADLGDVSITIDGFPNVPLTIVMWRGDGELEPEASILFDDSISGYLDTEDITVLCQTMSFRLAGLPF